MKANPTGPDRVWNGKFIMLLVIDLVVITGNFMVRPMVSPYAVHLGSSMALAGIVSGLAWFIATVLRPVTGYFADRLNKKTSFLIATAASAVSALGCSIAGSVGWLALFIAVAGVSMSFQAIALTSLVALCVPQHRVGTGIGWMGIIMNVTMAIGPALATAVADWGGYQASFMVGGLLCMVGTVLVVLFKAPAGSEGMKRAAGVSGGAGAGGAGGVLQQAFHGPTVPIAITALLIVWSGSSLSTLMITVQETGYLGHATLYFALYAIVGLGSRPLAGWLSDRVRSALLAVPLLAIGAAGLVALVLGGSLGAVVVCGICMGLGQASAISVIQAESVRGVDPEHLGRASNTYFMGVDLGGALGTWVGGLLLQAFTPAALFAFNALTCAAAMVLIVVLRVRGRMK